MGMNKAKKIKKRKLKKKKKKKKKEKKNRNLCSQRNDFFTFKTYFYWI